MLDPRLGVATVYGRAAGIDDRWIMGVTVDAAGHVWAGARDGLYRSAGRGTGLRFERVSLPQEPWLNFVYATLIDRRGRLWVGSSAGVFRRQDGQWIRLTTRDGLLHNRVQYLSEGRDGALWVGYSESLGLSQMLSDGPPPRWYP
jgi:ligand-binding sensor domain-containing protein